MSTNYLFTDDHTRLQLIKSCGGSTIFNWLFLPGGPGCDSNYLLPLVNQLELPGNSWLVDLPNNGSNLLTDHQANFQFDTWRESLITLIKNFPTPILVGHSFGGIFPLLLPELEEWLHGLVILNGAPCDWQAEVGKLINEHGLPSTLEEAVAFQTQPSDETLKQLVLASSPYSFHPDWLQEGKLILEKMTLNYHATLWWLSMNAQKTFAAQWVPQKIPTLLLGGSHDFTVPCSLFEQDKRFHRDNIHLVRIENAGHCPWLEKREEVHTAFQAFLDFINKLKI